MTGRRLWVVGAVAGLVLVATILVYLRSTFSGDDAVAPSAAGSPATPGVTDARGAAPPTRAVELAAALATDDPAEFASVVAAAIFDWETTSGHGIEEYVARLVDHCRPDRRGDSRSGRGPGRLPADRDGLGRPAHLLNPPMA